MHRHCDDAAHAPPLSAKLLEDVLHEFQMSYRAKIEHVQQDIARSIPTAKAEAFQKFMRGLMLRYSSLVDLIKQGHPQLVKEMTPPHLILLDMKNVQFDF